MHEYYQYGWYWEMISFCKSVLRKGNPLMDLMQQQQPELWKSLDAFQGLCRVYEIYWTFENLENPHELLRSLVTELLSAEHARNIINVMIEEKLLLKVQQMQFSQRNLPQEVSFAVMHTQLLLILLEVIYREGGRKRRKDGRRNVRCQT